MILVEYGCTRTTWDTLNFSPLSSNPFNSMDIVDIVDIPVVLTAT